MTWREHVNLYIKKSNGVNNIGIVAYKTFNKNRRILVLFVWLCFLFCYIIRRQLLFNIVYHCNNEMMFRGFSWGHMHGKT